MKVFLDDSRDTPEGWTRTYCPAATIELLKTGLVSELSLDHDLGDDSHGTGYDVLLWIEREVVLHSFRPPIIKVHSSNPSARKKMELAIQRIKRYLEEE